jgi:hypothetical protein
VRHALTKACANNSVRWFDTSEDTSDASRKYLKAYTDSNAGTGEVYRMKSDPTPRCTSPQELQGVHVLREGQNER